MRAIGIPIARTPKHVVEYQCLSLSLSPCLVCSLRVPPSILLISLFLSLSLSLSLVRHRIHIGGPSRINKSYKFDPCIQHFLLLRNKRMESKLAFPLPVKYTRAPLAFLATLICRHILLDKPCLPSRDHYSLGFSINWICFASASLSKVEPGMLCKLIVIEHIFLWCIVH